MGNIEEIKSFIDKGETGKAIEICEELVSKPETQGKDYIYYLMGNAYRKEENWQKAMNCYQYAIEINPSSPAVTARKMIIDILNYYYKDQFNQ